MDRNVAFNTLLAVSTPDLRQLTNWPVETESPRWQISSLYRYHNFLRVVWIAKEFEDTGGSQAQNRYIGVVEAHFAGSPHDCLNFLQVNNLVPRNSCSVKRDMSAIASPCQALVSTHSTEIYLSWMVSNDIQDAVVVDDIQELPVGLFLLDECQEKVIALTPPLLLESRSGMGKTEILFKHCISYSPGSSGELSHAIKPTCFVTVSAKLCQELQRRYDEVQKVEQVVLPRVSFFSFRGMLAFLLRVYHIAEGDTSVSSSCNFLEYVHSRKSHEKLEVEPSLVENEIGGVILGSLTAAIKKRALTREEYLEEKRSNVPIDCQEGWTTRKLVYKEYENYQKWKIDNECVYDIHDIVLRLIRESSAKEQNEIFHSAYLDEVQDFSYASIFLICSIAGKTEARWTAGECDAAI